MDHVIELSNQLALLRQQLRMKQLASEHQRRVTIQVRSQVWQPYALMNYVEYEGTLYLSNHNFGWSQHPNTSWNTTYTTLQTPQVQRSSLDEKMAELERIHVELVLENAEFRRSRLKWTMLKLGCLGFLIKRRKVNLHRRK